MSFSPSKSIGSRSIFECKICKFVCLGLVCGDWFGPSDKSSKSVAIIDGEKMIESEGITAVTRQTIAAAMRRDDGSDFMVLT